MRTLLQTGGVRKLEIVVNFYHYEFNVTSDQAAIVVELDTQANVRLLDPTNFSHYRHGRQFRGYGGLVKESPFWLHPPHPGRWHVIIDLGGYAGTVRHAARIIQ